ncbi:hypothetical protein [Bacillus alkalisoli]|uniref:hypothetical protein n=1 Tax=Bacillus alkalisoli TaxID=2011008 RepID=UPI000C23B49C|nr:hypothetical protein [Bacillus alkalisoli]
MNYSLNEFLGELSYNCGLIEKVQHLTYSFDDFTLSDSNYQSFNEMENILLSVNDTIRVEKNTAYKVHKGYPSPRSIYPIQMFIAKSKNFFLTKNDQLETFELYKNNQLEAKEGDLVFVYKKRYPSYYQYIKKTLFLLELGHFLYNVMTVARHLKIQFTLEIKDGYLLLRKTEREEWNESEDIQTFLQKCRWRNSGPYKVPINSFHIVDQTAVNAQGTEDELRQLLPTRIDGNFIQPVSFHQDGTGLFYRQGKTSLAIPYEKLNEAYPYINFRGVSTVVIFLLYHQLFKNESNLAEYLIATGFKAQFYCLDFAKEGQYCRPIKSFNIGQMENIFNIDSRESTILYTLIAGSAD